MSSTLSRWPPKLHCLYEFSQILAKARPIWDISPIWQSPEAFADFSGAILKKLPTHVAHIEGVVWPHCELQIFHEIYSQTRLIRHILYSIIMSAWVLTPQNHMCVSHLPCQASLRFTQTDKMLIQTVKSNQPEGIPGAGIPEWGF